MARDREHTYSVQVRWSGNLGTGTSTYTSYSRNHEIAGAEKGAIAGSADPAFRGDPSRYNPEELLVGSLSSCHMLWYLHLCAVAGVVVTDYIDHPVGTMTESSSGAGAFARVLLRPVVNIEEGSDSDMAKELHGRAHEMCFISRSVNFPVECEPTIQVDTTNHR